MPRTVARTVWLSTGGMAAGSRSRSSWPLTGRTTSASRPGSPAIPAEPQPAATTTVPQLTAAPLAASRRRSAGPPVPVILVTWPGTVRTPAACAARRSAAR